MTQLSQQLFDRAEELRLSTPTEVAVDLLKQAGFSEEDARYEVAQITMEKEAANHLSLQSGIDIEQAVILVKAAGVNVRDLPAFQVEAPEVDPTVELLQKAAQYIESLEAEIEANKEALEKSASEQQVQEIELPGSLAKAASAGAFTNDDLAQLRNLNPELLTKVASVTEPAWEMGRGAGFARPQTDPLFEFIVSNND